MEISGLKSRVIKTEDVNWRDFQFIQSKNFKSLAPDARHKLKASILANNFTQPFYVWEDPEGTMYCLDGKHRTILLEELINEGHQVPYSLPATFIDCRDKKEAAKLVTIYSSIYARVEQQGLFDFLKEYDLSFEDLKGQIDLPEFSLDRFEQKFDLFQVNIEEEEGPVEVPEDDQVIVKPGDRFRLGNHQVCCCDFRDEIVTSMMAGQLARIVLTDPPYNVNLSDILVKKKHKNFKEAHGEMDDMQFIAFIKDLFFRNIQFTVDGGIHFIFMDWRHVWHMTEAAKVVYGSPEPKQLCVWTKDMMAMGSFYRSQHEFVFVFKKGEEKHLSHIDLVDRIRTNVWNYPSGNSMRNPDKSEMKNHPTPKPVSMLADAILDTTNQKDLVIDFFLGSGSTLIACEKTSRQCRATEIEPKYVQSTINRYLRYCSKNGLIPTFEHLNGSLTINEFDYGKP